jgi:DtxR family Mn-dependent transcriptional regulator
MPDTSEKFICINNETGLSPHMEDYMEAIIILSQTKKIVRVKDIAKELSIKMPSVTAALSKLKEMGLLEYEKYGYIELTLKGIEIAENVYKRHESLADFYSTVLMLNEKEADSEACRSEHALAIKTQSRMKSLLEFFKAESIKGSPWVDEYTRFISK